MQVDDKDIIDMIDYCKRHAPECTQNFIESLEIQFKQRNNLSSKQLEVLQKIFDEN